MYYLGYNLLWALAKPLLQTCLRLQPKYSTLLSRFRPEYHPTDKPPIWIQACSVGEVNTARPLVDALARRFPTTPILLTTSTVAGYALAVNRYADTFVQVMWMPFDHRVAVRRCIESINPRILILLETEIWPNLLRETERFGTPTCIVNGRLSDKHYRNYQRWQCIFSAALQYLNVVGVQNERYAERFEALGYPKEKLMVTGNLKFDAVTTAVDAKTRNRLRLLCGYKAEDLLLVFGSTRPGDEALALQCWRDLRSSYPHLRLVIVPRHLERVAEIQRTINAPHVLRSGLEQPGGRDSATDILLVDTMGELVFWYALASVAVIGGSFHPGVEGHNPLEPAALGVPTVFGPYISNFRDPAKTLLEAEGAVQVMDVNHLPELLHSLLDDPAERRQLGTRARKVVLKHQGAVEKNVDLVESVLMGQDQALSR